MILRNKKAAGVSYQTALNKGDLDLKNNFNRNYSHNNINSKQFPP